MKSVTYSKILMSGIIFFLSIGACYLPFRAKGYAPDPAFANLAIARNLAVAGTFQSEDEKGIFLSAAHAATQGRATAVESPLTPIIYSWIFKLVGTDGFALSLPFYVSIALAALFNVSIFLMIDRLFGTVVGFTSAMAMSLMPVRVMGALLYGGYEFAMLFFAIALAIFFSSKNGPFKAGFLRIAFASVFFALAALARSAFLISFVPFVLYDFYVNRAYKRSLVLILPFLVIFGSTLTPISWLGAPNGYVSGVRSESFDVLGEVFPDPYTYSTHRDEYIKTLYAQGLDRSGAHFLKQWGYPVGLHDRLSSYKDSAVYYLKTGIDITTFGGPMILLFAVLGGSWLYRNKKEVFWFFSAWLLVWAGGIVFFQTGNWDHFLEILPIVAVLFGLGVKQAADLLRPSGGSALVAGVILLFAMCHLAYSSKWRLSIAYDASHGSRLSEASDAIMASKEPGVIAVGVHPSFAYGLNYFTDKDIIYFNPKTIVDLRASGGLKDAFDRYHVEGVVGIDLNR